MEENNSLLTGDVRRIFFRYLIPTIGGMLGTALYVLGDTIIIGLGLGAQGLAALNMILPLFKIINSFGLIFGVGGATALAVSRGRGNEDEANKMFTISMVMSVVFGLVFMFMRMFFLDEMVGWLGATDYTFDMVKSYLDIYLVFSIPVILNLSLGVFIRNDDSPRLVMVGILVSSFLNIVLDYIFVFPMELGMWGAALASGISPAVGVLIMFFHFFRDKNKLKLVRMKMEFKDLKRIVSNGFPSFIVELSVGFVIFLFNLTILKIEGDLGVSAYGIVANLVVVFSAIFTGIGQTLQPIVSINYGAREEERMLEAIKLGNIVAFTTGVLFFLIGFIFPENLAYLFTRERGRIIDLTVRGIRIYFTSFIVMGVNIAMTSYIQSKEENRISTFISLLRGSVYVGLSLFVLSSRFGLDGVWMTVPVAELLTLITYTVLFDECRDVFKYMFNIPIKNKLISGRL